MKSRLFFLMLCIALTFAYCTPMVVAEQTVSSSEASANDLPPVPQNGTLMIYQAYINNLMGKLMKDCQRRVAQAEKDGVNIQSEEFVKSINKVEKEYYVRMEEALDKAIRLKNVSNKNFEKLIELRYLLFAGMARVNGDDEKTIEVNMLKFADQLRNIEREDFADKIEVSLLDNKLNGCINRFDVDEFEKIAAEIDDKVAKAGKNITSGLAQQAMLIINVGRILAVKADYSIPDERIKKYNKALSMAIVKENIPEDVLPQLALGKIQLIKMAGKISNADEKTINERIELVINYFRKRNSKAAEKIELELFDKKVTEYRFKAAQKLAAATTHDEAKAAFEAIKTAEASTEALAWTKVAPLASLMKQVPNIDSKMKRTIPKRMDKKQDECLANCAAVAALMQGSIANADETEQPAETVKWTAFSIQGRDAAAAVAKAVAAQDAAAAEEAMTALHKSCDDCHAVFHQNKKAEND